MENLYKELDNVKAEMERLKAELRFEKGISETLKKSHRDQLIKFQDAQREAEIQAQELSLKHDEISQVRKLSATLQSCLHEKELSLRHFSSLHEKLRADRDLKLKKLEGENKELAFAFDEVSEKNKELEQNACSSIRDIDALKRRLLSTERKCFEVEQKAQAAKDLRQQRDDVIMKLEEENRNAQDQLKWKEKFKHLEEAHRRLQGQFKLDKEEWEGGKSALLEEISSLQTSLDSETRVLEDVQKPLEMCNRALAREESRRKYLEVQVSDITSRYEDAFAQCKQEASKFESLTVQRDEEIAKLRILIATRDASKKDVEIRIAHLEQENQELRESLKELQESRIRNAGATKLTKLRNKLRGLEQEHNNCSRNLQAKESEWSSQLEKMKGEKRYIFSKTLEKVSQELAEKVCQISRLEAELRSWKSAAESLKICCDQEKCRQTENSILVQFKDAEDKDCCIENLHKKITWLEQECFRREMEATILARFDAEKCAGRDKDRLFIVMNEQDQNIQSLEEYAASLEKDLTTVLTSSFAEAVENLATIGVLTKALKKARPISELQIEERNKGIVDLEKEVTGSCQRLIHQEEAMFVLRQKVEELEALLEAKNLETNELIVELKISEGKVKQLEYGIAILVQDTTQLSKERAGHMLILEEFCDRIGELTDEHTVMMDALETMLQGVNIDAVPPMGLTIDNSLYDSTQENESTTISASAR